MSFFRATEGDQIVADFRVNGNHHVTYKNVVTPIPLLSVPLRNRNLDSAVFAGSKLKIERARTLIGELYTILERYIQSKPIEGEERPHSSGGRLITMRMSEPLPAVVSAIAGDVIHNLRSALDLMICDLVRQNGGHVTRSNSYPTSQQGFAKQTVGVSLDAAKLLKRLRTASRWNEVIWAMHQLDLLDKHNTVIAVTGATVSIYAQVGVSFMSWGPTLEQAVPFPGVVGAPSGIRNVFLTENAVEVYQTSPWVDEQVRIKVTPVFAPDLPAEGEPIMDMLQLFGGVVERIVTLAQRRLF
jgi:hypothetical protein